MSSSPYTPAASPPRAAGDIAACFNFQPQRPGPMVSDLETDGRLLMPFERDRSCRRKKEGRPGEKGHYKTSSCWFLRKVYHLKVWISLNWISMKGKCRGLCTDFNEWSTTLINYCDIHCSYLYFGEICQARTAFQIRPNRLLWRRGCTVRVEIGGS